MGVINVLRKNCYWFDRSRCQVELVGGNVRGKKIEEEVWTALLIVGCEEGVPGGGDGRCEVEVIGRSRLFF